jgi:hypothetical protein
MDGVAARWSTIRRDGKNGYDLTVLGAVKIPSVSTPALLTCVTGPEAVRPVRASITVGGRWRGAKVAEFSDVKWPKKSGCQIIQQADDCGTFLTTWFPDVFGVRPPPGEADGIRFVLLPREDQLTPCSDAEHTTRVALEMAYQLNKSEKPYDFDSRIESIGDFAPYFHCYADLLATYLSTRVTSPVLLGAPFRALLLAFCLTYGNAVVQGRGRWREPYRHSEFICEGTRALGYGPGLHVVDSREAIKTAVPKIAVMINERFGAAALVSEDFSILGGN